MPTTSSSGKRPASDGKPLLTDGGGPGVRRGEDGRSRGVCAGCDEGVAPAMASELSTESRSVDMVTDDVTATTGTGTTCGMSRSDSAAVARHGKVCPSNRSCEAENHFTR